MKHPHFAGLLAAGLLMTLSSVSASATDISIQQDVNGQALRIVASKDQYAGAIYSVTYRGTEYIDHYDHGRELQSASSFDGLGECFNPTEAGSSKDGTGSSSTSILISAYASGNTLQTTNNMAFWIYPGSNYVNSCGQMWYVSPLSGHIFSKTVTIGYQGIPNLIRYSASFTPAENHNSATFEAATGYMPPSFSQFLAYNPKTRHLSVLSDGPGEQATPVILATTNGLNAMGVISPGLPQASYPNLGYGRFRFPSTTKWNCVYRATNILAGDTYTYNCFIAIGTVDEVMAAENRLVQSTSQPSPLFRFYNGKDHLLTAIYTEGASAGYQFEGTTMHVYPNAIDSGMEPIYRCREGNHDHFLSTRQDCEGQRYEGQYGFISSHSRPGYSALYRLYNSSVGDHMSTTNPDEGTNHGYRVEGILGYVN
ncbi:hypothetical protein GCM10027285_08790 [Oleiagrimonas citrea]|uniref:DUF5648 domain-containing protein n=1 Tax=Oleiagrimonas citrea TaxID=1665687 RepID=A0A846ZLX7_9GAMM|nr:hypothetical protein [Oleiagrimonas citrea]NKZ38558.1 hypothetical protein [Oleiagrimonas citrea]